MPMIDPLEICVRRMAWAVGTVILGLAMSETVSYQDFENAVQAVDGLNRVPCTASVRRAPIVAA